MDALLNIRLLACLTLLFLIGIASLNTAQTASVFIQPLEHDIIVDSSVIVTVSISDVNDLHSYSITLPYENSLVEIADVNELDFFSPNTTLFLPSINSTQNSLLVDAGILGADSQTGSGRLFEIEFLAKGTGDVNLNLQNIILRDIQNNDIPFTTSGGIIRISPVTDVNEINSEDGVEGTLDNYPNPFNNSTVISYYSSFAKRIELKIFSILGKEIYSETDENMFVGEHKYFWNGKSKYGKELSSGIYLIAIQEGNKLFTKKITLLK